jgi:hypothetical protein
MNIKQGKCVIQTAEGFFAWTESITSSSVKYFYVSNEDVENCSQYIQSVSSQLSSVPGIMKVHAVSPVCSEFIMICLVTVKVAITTYQIEHAMVGQSVGLASKVQNLK